MFVKHKVVSLTLKVRTGSLDIHEVACAASTQSLVDPLNHVTDVNITLIDHISVGNKMRKSSNLFVQFIYCLINLYVI